MKILTFEKSLFSIILFFVFNTNIYSQDAFVNVEQDLKFEELLNQKAKINNSIYVNDRYKIQIYNGNSETAKKTLSEFKKLNPNYDATIIFSTPTYKVWVGNIDTRIKAEKLLMDLQKKYPNALVIRPNK
ncbi:MAG TPA: SPOR domain-containing protein [Flavobacterium sp.]|nr:SPOR domain-containing protein [Flavobacterium sp.]